MIVRHYIYENIVSEPGILDRNKARLCTLKRSKENPEGGFLSESDAYKGLKDMLESKEHKFRMNDSAFVILKTYTSYIED